MMRLYKFPKVLKYLCDNNLVDERQIWCYAQLKAKVELYGDYLTFYGLVLVCIKEDTFYIYTTQGGGSTNLTFHRSFKISEINKVELKKNVHLMRFGFTINEDYYQLDMDDWERFSKYL